MSAIKEASEEAKKLVDVDYPAALKALANLRGPVDEFFETTMVMDKDEKIRANRIKILNCFIASFAGIADFGKFSK